MGDPACCPALDSFDLVNVFYRYEGSIRVRHTQLEALQEFDMLFDVCLYVWCVYFCVGSPVSCLLWWSHFEYGGSSLVYYQCQGQDTLHVLLPLGLGPVEHIGF